MLFASFSLPNYYGNRYSLLPLKYIPRINTLNYQYKPHLFIPFNY
ncbi:hypothetical protein EDC53_106289 [Phytobacter diazotrophicus]|nr:hypothetical protein EDC53_106289 [Phytobacter diazotrophicus]